MRDSLRDDLLRNLEGSNAAQRFLDGLPEVDDEIEEVIDEAAYAAAQRMDPTVTRANTYVVRLAGQRVATGELDSLVNHEIVQPLLGEIDAAAGPHVEDARLALIGISSGSLVLHFRPARAIAPPEAESAPIEVTTYADQAVRTVLRLHDMLETQAQPAEIASAYGDQPVLLRKARDLTGALAALELDMFSRWWTTSGERLSSRVTAVGRQHAARVFAETEKSQAVTVSGLITALDIDGAITIKPAKSARLVIQADPEQVRSGAFVLGSQLTARVIRTDRTDRVGLSKAPILSLVERLADGELPLSQ